MPSIRHAAQWLAGPVVLTAILAWVSGGTLQAAPAPGDADLASVVAKATGAPPASSAAARGRATASAAASTAKAAEVARTVEERNRAEANERSSFEKAGWILVDVAPPDQKLVTLDPSLLDGREGELRVQMASTVAAPDQSPRLAEIARRAQDEVTQIAAVEALGRVRSPEAQSELLDLLDSGDLKPDSKARAAIAPLLQPKDLHDPAALELARHLDSPRIQPVERKQIAFTLALLSLRDRDQLPPGALAALSASSRALLVSMTQLATLNPSR